MSRMDSRRKRRLAKRRREYGPLWVMRKIVRELIGSRSGKAHSIKKGKKGYNRKRNREGDNQEAAMKRNLKPRIFRPLSTLVNNGIVC